MADPRITVEAQSDGRYLVIGHAGDRSTHMGWLSPRSIVGMFRRGSERGLLKAFVSAIEAQGMQCEVIESAARKQRDSD